MCTSPIKIKSRLNHYDLRSPLYHIVPCGKCEECQRDKCNEWFVRCYYEFQQSKQTFFYTLTLNNANLPFRYGMPCFSKRQVQKFLDRLRKALKPFNIKLRYMVTSEYGELYKRPHYHALFFIDNYINPFQFYKLVERCWSYGFVKYGDNVGVVNSSSGIKYVTKYISKDFSYSSDFDKKFLSRIYLDAQRFINWMHLRYPEHELCFNDIILDMDVLDLTIRYRWLSKDKNDYYSNEELREFCDRYIVKLRNRFNAHRPFHLQSSKLGCSILDLPSSILDKCLVPVMSPQGVVEFPLPRYFKRKLWYDVVENETDHKMNRFVLNDKGKQHLLATLNDKIQSSYERLQNIVLNAKGNINESIMPLLSSCRYKFQSYNDFHFWLNRLDIDLYSLAVYSSVFRGRVCPFPFNDVKFTSFNLKNSYIDYVKACLYETTKYDYGKIYRDEYTYREMLAHTFDCHPFFQIYDSVLQVLETIQLHLSSQKSDARMSKERLLRYTKQFNFINSNPQFTYG